MHFFCIFLSLSHLLTKQCRDCKLAPCEDKIQLIQFLYFFKVVFSLFLFWGLFFLVTENLLYLGDQHLKHWIPVQKPARNSAQTMKVFKGKIVQGRKGQSLYLSSTVYRLPESCIVNNFESVANLSTSQVLHQNPHSTKKISFWQPGKASTKVY